MLNCLRVVLWFVLFEHGLSRSVTEYLFNCIRAIRVIRTGRSALFCTDLSDSTDIHAQLSPCSSVVCFIRTRTFTECHGISVQLHPCNPCDPYRS